MKRMGTFCDSFECNQPAIGTCVCCDKDCCAKHGSMSGIELHITRAVEAMTTQQVEMIPRKGVSLCYRCVGRLAGKVAIFADTVMPELLERIGEAIKAGLSAEVLKDG